MYPKLDYSWTYHALLAGEKKCTRRKWAKSTAEAAHWWSLVAAWSGHHNGLGRHIAWLYVTAAPLRLRIDRAPDSDYVDEGFAFYARRPELVIKAKDSPLCLGYNMEQSWRLWQLTAEWFWVIRTHLVGYTPAGIRICEESGIEPTKAPVFSTNEHPHAAELTRRFGSPGARYLARPYSGEILAARNAAAEERDRIHRRNWK